MKNFIALLGCLFLSWAVFSQDQPTLFLPPITIEPVSSSISAGQYADYYLAAMSIPHAWGQNKGEGAVVFGLDTGKPSIPDISQDGYVYAGNFTSETINDGNNHGTMIASVACALDNNIGAIGIAPSALFVPVKVMQNNGTGYDDQAAKGIQYCADVNLGTYQGRVRILSLSFGSSAPMPKVEAAIKYAVSKGCIVVAAAGNSGCTGAFGYPAAYPEVISVASVGKTSLPSSFSNCFAGMDCAAYGEQIYVPTKEGTYVLANGTSFSCPEISGWTALIATKYKAQLIAAGSRSYELMLEFIKQTSFDLHVPGYDTRTGWGLPKGTAIDKPMPSLPPPTVDPPSGPVREVSLSISGEYTAYWKPSNANTFTVSKVGITLVNYKTKARGTDIPNGLASALQSFWTNRGFELLADNDEVDAVYWFRYFTELILKGQGYDISVQEIWVTTNNSEKIVLLGSQRRTASESKVASISAQTNRVRTYTIAP